MKSTLLSLILALLTQLLQAQDIFAHNDYLKPNPFYAAFELKVAYIEADIFLQDGELLVAHTKREIDPSKTLESMYLEPLLQKVQGRKWEIVRCDFDDRFENQRSSHDGCASENHRTIS